MGFIYPMESSTRAVEIAYIWRQFGSKWTDDELAQVKGTLPNVHHARTITHVPHPFMASDSKQGH